MTIEQFMRVTTTMLGEADIPTARLDTQVLLERALKQNKAWLLAHGDEEIPAEALAALQNQVQRRVAREPLAYIMGRQEFYGRNFTVSPAVLIPRPESEQLIEELKTLPLPDGARLIDVGTGSGALAITAELEFPHLRTEACDTNTDALAVAQANAERLGAQVQFFVSDLLQHAHPAYNVIVANLPYVAEDWDRSPETNFEPAAALFAADHGLALIKKLVMQAPAYLTKKGYLLLEADPRQHAHIKKAAGDTLSFVKSNGFALVFQK